MTWHWTRPWIRGALVAAVVGLGSTIAGAAFVRREQLLSSYLCGYLFWFGIALGCLAVQLIHALTGGRWGMLVRRPLCGAAGTLPLCGVLFLPLAFGVRHIYPWARPGAELDPLLLHKRLYLNEPFWLGRAAGLFLLWSALGLWARRRTLAGGVEAEPGPRLGVVGAVGLPVLALTMTVAAVDWLMSLDPHWISTMFGVLVMGGQLLAAVCFCLLGAAAEAHHHKRELPGQPLNDVANLMLVFVVLWTYLSYSQYFIVYAGNVAHDTAWYAVRSHGGWQHVATALVLLHFALPCLVLLSKRVKRSGRALSLVASGILLMRLCEVFWLTAPSLRPGGARVHWLDVAALLGVGGLWLAHALHGWSKLEPRPAGGAA